MKLSAVSYQLSASLRKALFAEGWGLFGPPTFRSAWLRWVLT